MTTIEAIRSYLALRSITYCEAKNSNTSYTTKTFLFTPLNSSDLQALTLFRTLSYELFNVWKHLCSIEQTCSLDFTSHPNELLVGHDLLTLRDLVDNFFF